MIRSIFDPRVTRPLLLGGLGLVFGYFGPLHFAPQATLGPLVGIFFTGPIALVLGFVLEWLSSRWHLRQPTRIALFLSAIAVVVGGSLLLSQPGPQQYGSLIDGQIIRCDDPATRLQAAVQEWDRTFQGFPTWPRPGWHERASELLAEHPGVVLTILVYRVKYVTSSSPYAPIHLSARRWRRAERPQTFFADFRGSTCNAYAPHVRQILWRTMNCRSQSVVPPDDLPCFLHLDTLAPVPREMLRLATTP